LGRLPRAIFAAVAWFLAVISLTGCLPRDGTSSGASGSNHGDKPYGPVLPPPISIRLGQSLLRANGSVGPKDGPQGSPAIWEGHSVVLEPDQERNRTLYFFVEGIDLHRVTVQVDDHEPYVEEQPGVYLSGEIAMVRWAQDYSLRVTAEDVRGTVVSSAIFVNGEDARVEGSNEDPPLRIRMLRMGPTETVDVRGTGYRGKIHRHPWTACSTGCDLTSPGGVLVAMVTGPTDTLLLLIEGRYPYITSGLSAQPSPHYMIVAIPVRDESSLEIAALTTRGDVVNGRWTRPGG
jgi:hypothetical protein